MKSDRRRKYFIERKILKKLYLEQKFSLTEIGKLYKCSKGTIQFWLNKYKIKIRTLNEANKLSRKYSVKINKQELQDAYNNSKSINSLAEKFDCKNSTIIKKLRDFDITHKFSSCKRTVIDKENLIQLYSNQKLTTNQIADKYHCSQAKIWKLLKKYNIKSRKPSNYNSNIPTKKILIELYINQKLSTWKIEKLYGYRRGTTHRKLREYGIKLRSPSESHIIYKRKSFDKDIYEKVYLIGFRLGDLRVRKTGETIKTDCASTKPAQIELIRSLFEDYGRVWISKPRIDKNGKLCRNIEAFLDLSFDFLLPKNNYQSIISNKDTFIPFLAGFTDAEGHIGVHNNKAVYSIGNYNKNLIIQIKHKLKKYLDINTSLAVTDLSKYKRKDGYVINKLYWMLITGKKQSLIQLFNNIETFMKHKDKLNAIKQVRNNINERNLKYGNKKTEKILYNNTNLLYK
ncbi:MAG: LAGLIDADG family homing endonuclease [Nanoarchaeota archaeon]